MWAQTGKLDLGNSLLTFVKFYNEPRYIHSSWTRVLTPDLLHFNPTLRGLLMCQTIMECIQRQFSIAGLVHDNTPL